MTDLHSPLADTLISKLAADTGIQALLGNPARVYDHRPAMASFPYAVIAQGEARDMGTKTLAAVSHGVNVEIFSRQRSGKECRQVLAAIKTALHDASVTLAAGSLSRCQEEFATVRFDEEAQAAHAQARYRCVVSD